MNRLLIDANTDPNAIENPTKFVALSATFSALVFIATAIFQLAITATGGYFNFGESMVYLAALVGGPLVGLVSGAVGSSLSDIITGYGIFAPGTFVIKGIEGYVAGYIFLKLRRLNKDQIKAVYIFFSAAFLSLSIILTTPSLYGLVGYLVNGQINFGKFPMDIGNYAFSFLVVFYSPQFNSFNLLNLQNLIVWNPIQYQFDIPGMLLILLSILFIALIWFIYYYYGKRSNIIISCAFGGVFMVAGYFLYELFVLGYTLAQPAGEMPFNILQVITGIIIALLTYIFLVNSGTISDPDNLYPEQTAKKAD